MRPADRGGPYDDYFRALNRELKANGPMCPVLLIDLDRLDHNIDVVMRSVRRGGKHLRLVEKSLPSPGLLAYIARRAGTRRLMSFHQPFSTTTRSLLRMPTSSSASRCRCVRRNCSTASTRVRSTRRGSCNG